MNRRSIYRQGILCAAVLGFVASAGAQVPPAPVPASPVVPPSVVTHPAAVTPPARPLPPTVEERDDPFQPPPTDAEKRAEDERRIRDIVRPLIDQMRENINQGVGSQIQEGVRGALEEFGRNNKGQQPAAPSDQPPVEADKSGKAGKPAPRAAEKPDPEDEKAEKAEARLQAALEKAIELSKDEDPVKRQEGRARLEQIRRGQMPKWSSSEGVFFIGCINKRKLYRDRFGDIFQSELWFSGSSAGGGTGGGSYATARSSGQHTASAGSAGSTGSVATVDPCAD